MELRVGERLGCVGCDMEVIVVRAPEGQLQLACGGESLVEQGDPLVHSGVGHPAGDGTLIGKRYANESGLELLCTKGGAGTLTGDGQPLSVKAPKSLPSSD